MTILYIKNMCCRCCIRSVEEVLRDCGVSPVKVVLGEAHLLEPITPDQLKTVGVRLNDLGFELLYDAQGILVEHIRTATLAWVKMEGERPPLSRYIQDTCNREYSSLSKLFSQVCGYTIERYSVLQRIEWAKELIKYSELNISEIAFKLGYSSLVHFSKQFKKEIGLSPQGFRNQQPHKYVVLNPNL